MAFRTVRGAAENLVDLAGIEPATSSMPWNQQNRILLTAQALMVG